MFKGIVFILCVGISFLGTGGLAYSQQKEKDDAPQAIVQKAEVGNKICPVSAEKIHEKMKATYEYEGKVYNFCCAGCIDEFKKDPQKYIKKVEEEMQAHSATDKENTAQHDAASHEGHSMH